MEEARSEEVSIGTSCTDGVKSGKRGATSWQYQYSRGGQPAASNAAYHSPQNILYTWEGKAQRLFFAVRFFFYCVGKFAGTYKVQRTFPINSTSFSGKEGGGQRSRCSPPSPGMVGTPELGAAYLCFSQNILQRKTERQDVLAISLG